MHYWFICIVKKARLENENVFFSGGPASPLENHTVGCCVPDGVQCICNTYTLLCPSSAIIRDLFFNVTTDFTEIFISTYKLLTGNSIRYPNTMKTYLTCPDFQTVVLRKLFRVPVPQEQ